MVQVKLPLNLCRPGAARDLRRVGQGRGPDQGSRSRSRLEVRVATSGSSGRRPRSRRAPSASAAKQLAPTTRWRPALTATYPSAAGSGALQAGSSSPWKYRWLSTRIDDDEAHRPGSGRGQVEADPTSGTRITRSPRVATFAPPPLPTPPSATFSGRNARAATVALPEHRGPPGASLRGSWPEAGGGESDVVEYVDGHRSGVDLDDEGPGGRHGAVPPGRGLDDVVEDERRPSCTSR